MRKLITLASFVVALLSASTAFAVAGGEGLGLEHAMERSEHSAPESEHNAPEREYFRERNGDITKVERNGDGTSIQTKDSSDGHVSIRTEAPGQDRLREYSSAVERSGGTRIERPSAPEPKEPREHFSRGMN